jgi:enoyl-CoA hydratase/carnithine racemase
VTFVDYEKKGSIVTITINRPERLNALGYDTVEGLTNAFRQYEEDPGARVAIVTGVGRSFSSGQDVKELATGQPPVPVSSHVTLDVVTKPVIGAINGLALGGGCLLMMACDIRIAAESASFAMLEVKWAIPILADRFLAQNIPTCVVMELLLTGESISAERAYNAGLVNKVVPDEALMPEAVKIAETISELSPAAIRVIKQSKIDAVGLSEKDLEIEEDARQAARKTADFREASAASLEKRKPVYEAVE